jgi:hypothetical protein
MDEFEAEIRNPQKEKPLVPIEGRFCYAQIQEMESSVEAQLKI